MGDAEEIAAIKANADRINARLIEVASLLGESAGKVMALANEAADERANYVADRKRFRELLLRLEQEMVRVQRMLITPPMDASVTSESNPNSCTRIAAIVGMASRERSRRPEPGCGKECPTCVGLGRVDEAASERGDKRSLAVWLNQIADQAEEDDGTRHLVAGIRHASKMLRQNADIDDREERDHG